MTVSLKTADEIAKMRVAGKLAADVLMMIGQYVKAGVTTEELNTICHDYIVNVQNAIPAPLNYRGFPKSICTSVNHVVCHGIPTDKKVLKNGALRPKSFRLFQKKPPKTRRRRRVLFIFAKSVFYWFWALLLKVYSIGFGHFC